MAPPPPYEQPVFPVLRRENAEFVVQYLRSNSFFNSKDIFDKHVEAEEKLLCATGLSAAKSGMKAQKNVSRTWHESGFLQLPDMKEFDEAIERAINQLVGKPITTVWARDSDSFDAWLISRPWCQYHIAGAIMTLERRRPSVYKQSSDHAILKIEWRQMHEDAGRDGWFWKGEDTREVIRGLLQPRIRRCRRLVERTYKAKRDAELAAEWQELKAIWNTQKEDEEGPATEQANQQAQAQVKAPKTKSTSKAKKPSPATASKKKPARPKTTKQETPKRGKAIAEEAPKKRKATAKEPVPKKSKLVEPATKKRKAAEPAKAKKAKAADQTALKRRKVTK